MLNVNYSVEQYQKLVDETVEKCLKTMKADPAKDLEEVVEQAVVDTLGASYVNINLACLYGDTDTIFDEVDSVSGECWHDISLQFARHAMFVEVIERVDYTLNN